MVNGSENPLSDISEGAIKGTLDWTKDQVLILVNKIKNNDLAFINDIETINLVKQQLKTAEWDIYKRYTKDKNYRLLIQMGISLRKLENSNQEKLKNLRDKINYKFGEKGLHIAQFIQNGMLGVLLGIIIKDIENVTELEEQIKEIFDNIDKYVIFIKEFDDSEIRCDEIKTRIYSNVPSVFVICGKRSAILNAERIVERLKNILLDYSFKNYKNSDEEIIFLLTKRLSLRNTYQ